MNPERAKDMSPEDLKTLNEMAKAISPRDIGTQLCVENALYGFYLRGRLAEVKSECDKAQAQLKALRLESINRGKEAEAQGSY